MSHRSRTSLWRRMAVTFAALVVATVGTLVVASPAHAVACGFQAAGAGDYMVYTYKNCRTYTVGVKVDIIFAPDVHPVIRPNYVYTKRVAKSSVNQVRDIYIITHYN